MLSTFVTGKKLCFRPTTLFLQNTESIKFPDVKICNVYAKINREIYTYRNNYRVFAKFDLSPLWMALSGINDLYMGGVIGDGFAC
jgi:hypothetical protein